MRRCQSPDDGVKSQDVTSRHNTNYQHNDFSCLKTTFKALVCPSVTECHWLQCRVGREDFSGGYQGANKHLQLPCVCHLTENDRSHNEKQGIWTK